MLSYVLTHNLKDNAVCFHEIYAHILQMGEECECLCFPFTGESSPSSLCICPLIFLKKKFASSICSASLFVLKEKICYTLLWQQTQWQTKVPQITFIIPYSGNRQCKH